MAKGRDPNKQTDHAAALRDRLGQAAAEAFNPGVKWETYAEVQREQYRAVGMAVFKSITQDRRGMIGTFEVVSGYSSQRNEPFVEAAMDMSPIQMTPEKAREMGLMLIECAEAAESDAQIMGFAMGAMDMDRTSAAKLLDLFRQAREQRRGKKANTA